MNFEIILRLVCDLYSSSLLLRQQVEELQARITELEASSNSGKEK
jgi:BMFP domain-containing protein YqiC